MLMPRFRLIGHAIRDAHSPHAWGWCKGWSKYDHHEPLSVTGYDGGDWIWMDRESQARAALNIIALRPFERLRNKDEKEIPAGSPEIIDGATIPLDNYHGLTPLSTTYTPNFGETVRESDVRLIGFGQSVEATFKFVQGGEAAQFKFEQEIKTRVESKQETTKGKEKEKQRGRQAEFPAEAAPGVELEHWATMTIQSKKIVTSGAGDVDFGFAIGARDFKKGRWFWRAHKGQRRFIKFDSYWDEFIPMIKGEGARHHDCFAYFREHPAPGWLIDQLTAHLDLPFRHETPKFDGWITIKPKKRILRVNPVINPEFYELWQKDLAQ